MCLEPPSDELHRTKEDTIFVEVPPDAVSRSADVKMHYAIIPSGPFKLPEGYQFGSPVVYICYDSRHVTKPIKLHLPHWYGGEDHTRDGLSFAVAPHSLKGESVYHFNFLAGGELPVSSQYGAVEVHGHCSLYAEVFNLGATANCQAFCLEKEKEGETECWTECNIAVTYASFYWKTVRLIVRILTLHCSFRAYVYIVCLCFPCRSWRRTVLVGNCQSLPHSNSSQTG